MKPILASLIASLCLALAGNAFGQAGRIYTQPNPSDPGALSGHATMELTHAVAIEYDRTRVYRADLSGGGRQFRFPHLPIGKYDLLLFTKTGPIFEGLTLGAPSPLPEPRASHLKERVAAQDGFFNQALIHRHGLSEDGETLLAFVERYRADKIHKQNGEILGQLVRRFEVIEFARAQDDWQLVTTRHIYREGEPLPPKPDFRKTVCLPALSGVRVITAPKDLGEISLPQ